MINKFPFNNFMKARMLFFFLTLSLLFLLGCDRPGGEDEDGNSYTYGMQISSVLDAEEGTSYIIFDMASENIGNDELAEITVKNVIPSGSVSTTPSSSGGSTIFSDETDSLHLTAYRVDYFVDGFRNIGSYVGRINFLVPAGSSETFDLLLITGATKKEVRNSLNYESTRGYITITLSGYDGNGNEKSKSISLDTYVYTYKRITPTPSPTETATATVTATQTTTATATATATATTTF